jgi:hypothetical protein
MARRVRAYGRISGGTRVLERVVASREEAPRKGARYPSTSHVSVETSRGVRHDMAHAGSISQAEERLCEAAAILKISRRRKAMYGGLFGN